MCDIRPFPEIDMKSCWYASWKIVCVSISFEILLASRMMFPSKEWEDYVIFRKYFRLTSHTQKTVNTGSASRFVDTHWFPGKLCCMMITSRSNLGLHVLGQSRAHHGSMNRFQGHQKPVNQISYIINYLMIVLECVKCVSTNSTIIFRSDHIKSIVACYTPFFLFKNQ